MHTKELRKKNGFSSQTPCKRCSESKIDFILKFKKNGRPTSGSFFNFFGKISWVLFHNSLRFFTSIFK
jgi:hypothetical protein